MQLLGSAAAVIAAHNGSDQAAKLLASEALDCPFPPVQMTACIREGLARLLLEEKEKASAAVRAVCYATLGTSG